MRDHLERRRINIKLDLEQRRVTVRSHGTAGPRGGTCDLLTSTQLTGGKKLIVFTRKLHRRVLIFNDNLMNNLLWNKTKTRCNYYVNIVLKNLDFV